MHWSNLMGFFPRNRLIQNRTVWLCLHLGWVNPWALHDSGMTGIITIPCFNWGSGEHERERLSELDVFGEYRVDTFITSSNTVINTTDRKIKTLLSEVSLLCSDPNCFYIHFNQLFLSIKSLLLIIGLLICTNSNHKTYAPQICCLTTTLKNHSHSNKKIMWLLKQIWNPERGLADLWHPLASLYECEVNKKVSFLFSFSITQKVMHLSLWSLK